MCGIVGLAGDRGRRARPPHGGRGRPPRPRRRGVLRRRRRVARACAGSASSTVPAATSRCATRTARVRHRLQRRDLQLPRAARAASRQRGHTLPHGRRHRDRSCTSTRSTATPACTRCAACSPTRVWDRPAPQLRPGPRPARHQAALLRAGRAAMLAFASELKALLAVPGVSRDARRRCAAPVPRPCSTCRAPRTIVGGDPAGCRRATCSRGGTAASSRAALLGSRPRRGRAPARRGRPPPTSSAALLEESVALHRDQRRAARRPAVGRDRLGRRHRAAGRRRRPRQDVHGRLRRRRRRAASWRRRGRWPRHFGTDHHEVVVGPGPRRRAAGDRAACRTSRSPIRPRSPPTSSASSRRSPSRSC